MFKWCSEDEDDDDDDDDDDDNDDDDDEINISPVRETRSSEFISSVRATWTMLNIYFHNITLHELSHTHMVGQRY